MGFFEPYIRGMIYYVVYIESLVLRNNIVQEVFIDHLSHRLFQKV